MVKKFEIPPPLKCNIAPIVIDLKNPEQIATVIKDTGFAPLHTEVRTRLTPHLQSMFATITMADDDKKRIADDLGFALACMTALYVGQRVGALEVRLATSDEPSRNDVNIVISQCLNSVSDALGEAQASEIFRRLETITNEVLEQRFGHAR